MKKPARALEPQRGGQYLSAKPRKWHGTAGTAIDPPSPSWQKLHAGGEISAGGERDLLGGTGGDGRQKNHINEMRGWFRIGTAPEKHQRYSANHSF